MKQDLLDTIKSHGYWRFNFQPVTEVEIATLKECFELVEKCDVRLRGWSYPFIARREDNVMGEIRTQTYIGTWIDSGIAKEFWHMYKSGQFLHYKALNEDWYQNDPWTNNIADRIKPDGYLGVVGSVIFEVTEALEFVSRMIQNDHFKEGVKLNISLHNIKDRVLWFEDQNRVPFFHVHKSLTDKYTFSKQYSAADILSNSKGIATKIIIELFECFAWNPSKEQVEADQNRLLSGKLA